MLVAGVDAGVVLQAVGTPVQRPELDVLTPFGGEGNGVAGDAVERSGALQDARLGDQDAVGVSRGRRPGGGTVTQYDSRSRAPKDAGNGTLTRTTDSMTPASAPTRASLRTLSARASGAAAVSAPAVSGR